MKNVICLILFWGITSNSLVLGQRVIPLYEGKIPNSKEVPDQERETSSHFLTQVSRPTLTVYEPLDGRANHTAVIICPGGGYMMLNIDLEGAKVARRMNVLGITAFVLKYRLPDDSTMLDKSIGPLQDAQRALLVVRMRAKEWNIDTAKIGIMGFSAGGHLAASAGTHFERAFIENPSNVSLRPSFMILVYPIISFTDSLTSKITRAALVGKEPTAAQIGLFSADENVNSNTPPTFILHAGDDGVVSVKNSIALYLALEKHKVPAGLHIFPKGQHGFVLPPASTGWFDCCAQWLRENGWIQ